MIAFPATGFYAALCALGYIALSIGVIRLRYRTQVDLLDGGQEALKRAIRAHANFGEYVPFALLLMGLLEVSGAPTALLHGMGIAFLVGRASHAYSLRVYEPRTGRYIFRMIGMVITFNYLVLAALLLLWISLTS